MNSEQRYLERPVCNRIKMKISKNNLTPIISTNESGEVQITLTFVRLYTTYDNLFTPPTVTCDLLPPGEYDYIHRLAKS